MSKECRYCQSSVRKKMVTDNRAHKLKIGKAWGPTKHKKIKLMIGEWSGYTKTHYWKSSVTINYCPMCGRKLGGEK